MNLGDMDENLGLGAEGASETGESASSSVQAASDTADPQAAAPEVAAESPPETADGQPETATDGPPETAADNQPEMAAESQPEVAADSQPETETPGAAAPAAAPKGSTAPEPTRPGMKWYVLRVASNKEDQVREALEKKVRIEGIEDRIGRILVPTAKEKRMKAGLVRIIEKKLYPGYVFVEMATDPDGSIPENIWFLVKETMGVGDFIGSDGKPTSMRDHDVEMMLLAAMKPDEEAALQGLEFVKGDRVKIKEGSFQNFEGNVESIDEQKGVVTVLLTIFGRSTPVDVEYWQLEKV